MKKRLSITLTLLVFMFVVSFSMPALNARVAPPPEVVKAAAAGLDVFTDMDSGNEVRLGLGFQVNTVDPRSLIEEPGLTLEAMIYPLEMWRFLVFENGTPTALLTVAREGEAWKAVSFGGAELAAEIQTLQNAWPADSGFDLRFVRIYQARADFMQVGKGTDTLGYAPLPAAKVALSLQSFNLDASTLLHESEIMGPLRDMVKEALSVKDERDSLDN